MKDIEIRCGLTLTKLFLALFLVTMPVALGAQQNYLEQLGPPMAGAEVPAELGNINLTNGNLHLEIPLGSFPQRGRIKYEAKLVYDSRIWEEGGFYPTFTLSSYRPFNVGDGHGNYAMGGWRIVVTADNTASLTGAASVNTSCNTDGPPPNIASDNMLTGFFWVGPDGVSHTWQNLFTNHPFIQPGSYACSDSPGDIPGTAGYANDGSGFFLVVTNYSNMTVYSPDGTQVFPVFKDTNGNYTSNDTLGNVIDTLGRIPVVTTTNGNSIYYDVLNSQGGRSRYTVTTENINVSVPNYSGTLTVFQSVMLPNNTSYQFGYDTGTSGDNWGGITSVTLPTGGQITYGYTTYTDAWGASNSKNRWVSSRTSGGGTWSYTPLSLGQTFAQVSGHTVGVAADQQITVQKPSGDYAIYKSHADCQLGPFKNRERDFYSASGVLLKQEVIDRTPDICNVSPDGLKPIEAGAVPIRVTTTTFGDSGPALTSKTEYDYSNSPSQSNPTKISEWNFYTGTAPASADRVRQVTYSLTGNSTLAAAHINDKPLTVTLTDGASTPNQVAQTTYVYDNYTSSSLASTGACQSTNASQPSPAAPQHDYQAYCTGNTVRGNLTQVSKWLDSTGSSITVKTNTFDDTGNIVKTQDALSNPTTFEFSPSYGRAYNTKLTNALGHITTNTYDFNTGLLVSTTDPNGQTTGLKTTMNYDGMGRLIETDLPDGGKTTIDFNGDAIPLTITTTEVATPDPSIVNTTVLDGLGRTQTECLVDPEGNDCVDSGYDSNGRLSSESNPHRSVAAATDGISYFYYDGLDRKKSVTKPDGSVVSDSYDTQSTPVLAQTVTTTDETGRQRLTGTDAFGRLIAVAEPGNAFAGVAASGGLTISGTLQTKPATNGTPGTGSVTISGSEQSTDITPPCSADMGTCPAGYTAFDSGTVTITVKGFQATYNYYSTDTPTTIASGLAAALNGSSSPVHASSSGATVTITSNAVGTAADYSLSAVAVTSDPTDFTTGASFTASASGASLTGGTNGIPAVADAGTVTVSVGASFTASAPYGPTSNSTAAQVAAAMAGTGPTGLNRPGSPVSATINGGSIALTYNTVGVAGNVSVTMTSSPANSNLFPGGSFSGSTTLSGGADAYPSGLKYPYVTLYAYDTLDNLTCVEQHGDAPSGTGCSAAPSSDATSQWQVRRFKHDSLGRLIASSNPEANTAMANNVLTRVNTTNKYDANGNLLQTTSPATNQTGTATQTITRCYDALNRVTGKAYSAQTCTNGQLPSGTAVESSAYDAGINGIGHLTSWSDAVGTGRYTSFDPLGRVTGLTRTINGASMNMGYEYNRYGSISKLHYPSGAVITNTWDAAGRMVSAVDNGNATNPNPINYVTGATYDATGAPTGFVSGNSITNAFTYNNRLQEATISAATPTQTVFSIGYDWHFGNGDNGNVWSIANNIDNSLTQIFNYDSLNRLTSAQTAGNDCSQTTLNPNQTKDWGNSFVYDAWGNLLGKIVTKCSSESLQVTVTNNRINGFCYDAAGNLLNQGPCGTPQYVYDPENHITGAGGSTYIYGADGNRLVKTNGTNGTLSWYMSPGIVAAESDLSGNLQREYVYSNGKLVARKELPSNAVLNYFSDRLKTTHVVADAQGNPENKSDFYAFGGELQLLANVSNDYKFTGQKRDAETGLDYFGARYYSNALGRFSSPDPDQISGFKNMEDPQSWNGYALARNNVVSYSDPDGRQYRVCGPEGGNCSNQSDKQFERNKGKDEIFKDGIIYAPDGNGGFVRVGFYRYLGPDIDGDPQANLNAAKMLSDTEGKIYGVAIEAAGLGALGGIAAGGGGLAELSTATLPIGRYVAGQVVRFVFRTPQGYTILRMVARVVGGKITFKIIEVIGENGIQGMAVTAPIVDGLKSEAARQGFSKVQITGLGINKTFDLK